MRRTPMTKVLIKPLRSGKKAEISMSLVPDLPLIDGEHEADYIALRDACMKAVEPKGAIERIWLQEFIDYSWESFRLRRAKSALIQIAKKDAVALLLTECLGGDYSAKQSAAPIAQGWSANDAEYLKTTKDLFEEHGYDMDAVMALAISTKLDDLERIDRLIASYSTRQTAALRELEKRRDILYKRALDFSEAIITDADVEVLDTAK